MIRIVTDSSCDLPGELASRHRIEIVPLTIRFGDDHLVDREQLDAEEFWDRLAADDTLPETAAPGAGRFRDTYTRLASEGAEGIVVVCISEELSATAQAARLAGEDFSFGVPVRVVDSRQVSAALGLAVVATARYAETGAGLDAVEETARRYCRQAGILAALDTLEFLHRGGRIGGARAFLGGLLNVKPLITVAEGAVVGFGRVRSRSRALTTLADHVAGLPSPPAGLAVVHGRAPDLDDFLATLSQVHEDEPIVTTMGPVVGTHTGPGVLGVAYLQE
jgi:DegV family protein with EDD domain